MKDVSELGRIVKNLYPGKYDDIPDDELGRIYKQQHPGQYEDFVEVVPMTYQAPMNQPAIHLDSFVQQLDQLATKFDVNRGMLGAFLSRKKYEGQVKLLHVVVEQMHLMIQAMSLRTEAHAAHTRHKFALELERVLHQNQVVVIQLATSQGMTLDTYQQKLLTQLEVDKETLLMQEQSRIRLEEARELAKIEAKKEFIKLLGGAEVQSRMIHLDKIYDAMKHYYALQAVKAPKKELEAAKAHWDELEAKRDKGWETIIKRDENDRLF